MMKNLHTLLSLYKSNGTHYACHTLLWAGIFYVCSTSSTMIRGAVPPCDTAIVSLITGSPLDCRATGKAAPFFVAQNINITVMLDTENFGSVGEYALYSKPEIIDRFTLHDHPSHYKDTLHELFISWLYSDRLPDHELFHARLLHYELIMELLTNIETNYVTTEQEA